MSINPTDLGTWEGDTFVFKEPFSMADGRPCKRMVVEPENLGPGISRDQAMHMFINGIADPDSNEE